MRQSGTSKKSFPGGFLTPEQETEFKACPPKRKQVINGNSDAESKYGKIRSQEKRI